MPTITAFCRVSLLCLGLSLPGMLWAAPPDQVIGNFGQADLAGWQEKEFSGNTVYTLEDSPAGKVLHAASRAAASGLFKEVSVDLTRTPYLHWSWRVDATFKGNDERSKAGDDYPARVYVVVSGGLLFWRTRAVNYVWSSNQAVDSAWPNAFTDHAQMIAVRSGAADTGRWLHERRNVREDLQRLFGADIAHIDAVAVMTDSDNTGQAASADYGDIYFSAQ